MTSQGNVKAGAEPGTQVRTPKAPTQSQQQASLETTFTQSAAIGFQESRNLQPNLKIQICSRAKSSC